MQFAFNTQNLVFGGGNVVAFMRFKFANTIGTCHSRPPNSVQRVVNVDVQEKVHLSFVGSLYIFLFFRSVLVLCSPFFVCVDAQMHTNRATFRDTFVHFFCRFSLALCVHYLVGLHLETHPLLEILLRFLSLSLHCLIPMNSYL